MKDGKLVIARLWAMYDGRPFVREGTVLGLDPKCFMTLCIYLTKDSDKPNTFEEKGMKVFYLGGRRLLHLFNPLLVYRLVKIFKAEKVDIVQCHKHKAVLYGIIAAMIARVPVIFSHVEGLGRTRNIRRKLLNFFILKRVNKVLAVADRVKDEVLENNPGISDDKVFILGNSIDYKRFANVLISKKQIREKENFPADCFIFGTVGRLVPTKGQIYLVRAFAKVKQEIPNSYLVFIGDGRLRGELEKEIAAAGLTDSVCFLGRRENVPELLRAMDCFVLPSVAEGLPTVILEAMAADVPCIASAVGGIPEIIADNKTGFLVPPMDEKTLAVVMITVAKKPQQEIKVVVDNAREMVRNYYDHENIIRKLEYLYRTELQLSTGLKV